MYDNNGNGGCGCFFVMFFAALAWVTHVVYCIAHAMWILLFVGALVFPVGIVHGIMIWFGAGYGH